MSRLRAAESVDIAAFRASMAGLLSQAPTPEASEDIRRAAERLLAAVESADLP